MLFGSSGLTGCLCAAFLVVACATRTADVTQVPESEGRGSREPPERSKQSGKGAPAAIEARDAASLEDSFEEFLDEEEASTGPAIPPVPGCVDLYGKDNCLGVGAVMLACTGLGNIFDEAVAERLVACLTEANGTSALCSTSILEPCVLRAIESTPRMREVVRPCEDVLACPPPEGFEDIFTLDVCEAGLSSLRPEQREDFVGCMGRGCDFKLCVGRLL